MAKSLAAVASTFQAEADAILAELRDEALTNAERRKRIVAHIGELRAALKFHLSLCQDQQPCTAVLNMKLTLFATLSLAVSVATNDPS